MKVRTRLTEALFDKEKLKAMGAMLDQEHARSKKAVQLPTFEVGDTVEVMDVHSRWSGARCTVTKVFPGKNQTEVLAAKTFHFMFPSTSLKKVG